MAITSYELRIETVDLMGLDLGGIEIGIQLVTPALYTGGSPTEHIIPSVISGTTDSQGVYTTRLLPSSIVGAYEVTVGDYTRTILMPAMDTRLSAIGDAANPGEFLTLMDTRMARLVTDLSDDEKEAIRTKLGVGAGGSGGGTTNTTLALSGTTLTLTDSEGNSVDADLAALVTTDTNTTNASLALSGTTLTLTDSAGNSVDVDLANLVVTDTNTTVAGLTLGNDNVLTLTDSAGATQTVDLSSLGGGGGAISGSYPQSITGALASTGAIAAGASRAINVSAVGGGTYTEYDGANHANELVIASRGTYRLYGDITGAGNDRTGPSLNVTGTGVTVLGYSNQYLRDANSNVTVRRFVDFSVAADDTNVALAVVNREVAEGTATQAFTPASVANLQIIPIAGTKGDTGDASRPWIQYSTDGTGSGAGAWKNAYVAGDAFMRVAVGTMRPASGSSDWSAAIQFRGSDGTDGQDGTDGMDGTNGTDGADGVDGAPGADGADGADGQGVIAGGTTGQVLRKASGTDYDTEWADETDTDTTVSTLVLGDDNVLTLTDSGNTQRTVDLSSLAEGGGGPWSLTESRYVDTGSSADLMDDATESENQRRSGRLYVVDTGGAFTYDIDPDAAYNYDNATLAFYAVSGSTVTVQVEGDTRITLAGGEFAQFIYEHSGAGEWIVYTTNQEGGTTVASLSLGNDNVLTLTDSAGATRTVDLSDLVTTDTDTDTTNASLALSAANVLTLTDSDGNSVQVSLASLAGGSATLGPAQAVAVSGTLTPSSSGTADGPLVDDLETLVLIDVQYTRGVANQRMGHVVPKALLEAATQSSPYRLHLQGSGTDRVDLYVNGTGSTARIRSASTATTSTVGISTFQAWTFYNIRSGKGDPGVGQRPFYQYSTDGTGTGSGAWEDTYADGDAFIRIAVGETKPADASSDWSAAMRFRGVDGAAGADGTDGVDGADGADGTDGVGVPVGGTTGQVLRKASGTDHDTEWANDTDTNTTVTGLALNGTTLTLTDSEGNTRSVNLAALRTIDTNTFLQSASLSNANVLTLTLSDNTSITVDLSDLEDTLSDTNTTVTGLALDNSNVLTLTDSAGATVTVDLSALAGGGGGGSVDLSDYEVDVLTFHIPPSGTQRTAFNNLAVGGNLQVRDILGTNAQDLRIRAIRTENGVATVTLDSGGTIVRNYRFGYHDGTNYNNILLLNSAAQSSASDVDSSGDWHLASDLAAAGQRIFDELSRIEGSIPPAVNAPATWAESGNTDLVPEAKLPEINAENVNVRVLTAYIISGRRDEFDTVSVGDTLKHSSDQQGSTVLATYEVLHISRDSSGIATIILDAAFNPGSNTFLVAGTEWIWSRTAAPAQADASDVNQLSEWHLSDAQNFAGLAYSEAIEEPPATDLSEYNVRVFTLRVGPGAFQSRFNSLTQGGGVSIGGRTYTVRRRSISGTTGVLLLPGDAIVNGNADVRTTGNALISTLNATPASSAADVTSSAGSWHVGPVIEAAGLEIYRELSALMADIPPRWYTIRSVTLSDIYTSVTLPNDVIIPILSFAINIPDSGMIRITAYRGSTPIHESLTIPASLLRSGTAPVIGIVFDGLLRRTQARFTRRARTYGVDNANRLRIGRSGYAFALTDTYVVEHLDNGFLAAGSLSEETPSAPTPPADNLVHFGKIRNNRGGVSIVFADDDISTISREDFINLQTTFEVTGIPAGEEHRLYWAIADDPAASREFYLGPGESRPLTHTMRRTTQTLGGIEYVLYIMTAANAVGDMFNGEEIFAGGD